MHTTTLRIVDRDALALRRIQLERREKGNRFTTIQGLLHEAVELLRKAEAEEESK